MGFIFLRCTRFFATSNQSLDHSVGRGSGGSERDEVMRGRNKGVERLRGKKKKREHILGRSFVKHSWLALHESEAILKKPQIKGICTKG